MLNGRRVMSSVESHNKGRVSAYWNRRPCGSWLGGDAEYGSQEFFERTERARYELQPYIPQFARFREWKDKKVLEIGTGIGCDFSMFARYGAKAVGIDLTRTGAELTKRRLIHHNANGMATVGDAEHLPFANDTFDLVYSW